MDRQILQKVEFYRREEKRLRLDIRGRQIFQGTLY